MTNKAKPKVAIMLDKPRHLFMDLNAMVAFEEVTGRNLMQGIDAETMSARDFRALLWACLLHEDETLKIEDVGKMIHEGNIEELIAAVAKAWGVALPESKGEVEDPLAQKSQPG